MLEMLHLQNICQKNNYSKILQTYQLKKMISCMDLSTQSQVALFAQIKKC